MRPLPVGQGLSLRDNEPAELILLARRVEDWFGSPQDIEWAFERGRLCVLRSRPITGMPSAPAGSTLIPVGATTAPTVVAAPDRPPTSIAAQLPSDGIPSPSGNWIRSLGPTFDRPLAPLFADLLASALNDVVVAALTLRFFSGGSGAKAIQSVRGYICERVEVGLSDVIRDRLRCRRHAPNAQAEPQARPDLWRTVPETAVAPSDESAVLDGIARAMVRSWLGFGRPAGTAAVLDPGSARRRGLALNAERSTFAGLL